MRKGGTELAVRFWWPTRLWGSSASWPPQVINYAILLNYTGNNQPHNQWFVINICRCRSSGCEQLPVAAAPGDVRGWGGGGPGPGRPAPRPALRPLPLLLQAAPAARPHQAGGRAGLDGLGAAAAASGQAGNRLHERCPHQNTFKS